MQSTGSWSPQLLQSASTWRPRSPNPSIERTAKCWPRYSVISLLLPRGQLSSAALVKR
jgi:hypothetical protein